MKFFKKASAVCAALYVLQGQTVFAIKLDFDQIEIVNSIKPLWEMGKGIIIPLAIILFVILASGLLLGGEKGIERMRNGVFIIFVGIIALFLLPTIMGWAIDVFHTASNAMFTF